MRIAFLIVLAMLIWAPITMAGEPAVPDTPAAPAADEEKLAAPDVAAPDEAAAPAEEEEEGPPKRHVRGPAPIIDIATGSPLVPQVEPLDLLEMAHDFLELNQRETTALDELENQRMTEAQDAFEAILIELNAKYLQLAIDTLPPEKAELYKKLLVVESEYTTARLAAKGEFINIIKQAIESCETGGSDPLFAMMPRSRSEIIHRYVTPTAGQIAHIRKISEKCNEEFLNQRKSIKPPDRNDIKDRRRYANAVTAAQRESQEKIQEETLKLYTPAQLQAIDDIELAMFDYKEKTVALDEDHFDKLVELIGYDKLREKLRTVPRSRLRVPQPLPQKDEAGGPGQ